MSWEAWQDPQTKQLWGQILGQLEIAAREFARFHSDWQYEVIRTEWDAPNVELRWSSAGLDRNVNMLVKGTEWPVEVEFSGAAWTDGEDGRWLRNLDLPLSMRTIRLGALADVADLVPSALEAAAGQVQSIGRAAAAGAAG